MVLVSIPQAVGAVATFNISPAEEHGNLVSIPQAVGAVATCYIMRLHFSFYMNIVSIPQAVGAVATAGSRKPVFMRFKKLVLENLKP